MVCLATDVQFVSAAVKCRGETTEFIQRKRVFVTCTEIHSMCSELILSSIYFLCMYMYIEYIHPMYTAYVHMYTYTYLLTYTDTRALSHLSIESFTPR